MTTSTGSLGAKNAGASWGQWRGQVHATGTRREGDRGDAGQVSVGQSVKLGYFAQHSMELLDADATVWETLETRHPKASVGSLRTLAGVFGFSGDDIDKTCRILSGGEKARLVLARMLYVRPTFRSLTSPRTIWTWIPRKCSSRPCIIRGNALFVSHDRHFLRVLSNRVLELTPDGTKVYGGGYAEYVTTTGYEAPGVHA